MKQLDKKLAASNGGRVVKFIENFCVHGEGDFYGCLLYTSDAADE